MIVRERFRAMGTQVELLLEVSSEQRAREPLAAARRDIMALEARCSRFLLDSELSRLNRDRRARVSPLLANVIRRALELRDRTDGLFDPALGAAVRAAGYDRSFELLSDDPAVPEPPVVGGGAVSLTLGGLVALGPGTELDLGAVAKGFAADRAVEILTRAAPALVNIGGDLSTRGPRADGRPWTVAVRTREGATTLALPWGGLATSGTDRRRWRRGNRWQHHVIDPRSGRPARTDLCRATAVATSATEAEALATALLVGGLEVGRELADRWSIPAVLIPSAGEHVLAGGLA